jgi:hypothetical protein
MSRHLDRVEAVIRALAISPQEGAQALRAAGVKCVWEGSQIVLYEALQRLEQLEDGQWVGWSLMPGDEDAPPNTGEAVRDTLMYAVPYAIGDV